VLLSARKRILALAGVCAGVAATSAWAADFVSLSTSVKAVKYNEPFFLSGVVSSSRGGEIVTIERDDCGPVPWHAVDTASSGFDGVWRVRGLAEGNSRFRARWRDAVSEPVTVQLRPEVTLFRAKRGGFLVLVLAYKPFPGRLVVLQRFKTGGWATIGRARLQRGGGLRVYYSRAVFHAKVRAGATLRAVLTARQAGPCYAAGYSAALRVP
jgi:hypothetical protein